MPVVFVSIGMSLDGYIAGPHRSPHNPLGDRGPSIHEWMYPQRAYRQDLHLGAGGETGNDNTYLERTMRRVGVSIMGKRMFEEGEANWPENAPFHTPVLVMTHETRAPWQRPGATTFQFTSARPVEVLALARELAGGKDIRISGGANTILQFLHAGLVEELEIDLSPVLLGGGLRLFDGIDRTKVRFEVLGATHSPTVTHLSYAVRAR